MTNLIPTNVQIAAKRGFIRTATQSLASVIPTTAVAITLSSDWLLGVGLGTGSALIAAGLAGAASYLSITSSGIPEDYTNAPLH